MKIEQKKFTKSKGWETLFYRKNFDACECNLVIAFGNSEIINDVELYESIQSTYPTADILMNSTAGEIYDTQVNDNTVSLTAIQFDKTKMKTAVAQITNQKNSYDAGRNLAAGLNPNGLRNIFVTSHGLKVNSTPGEGSTFSFTLPAIYEALPCTHAVINENKNEPSINIYTANSCSNLCTEK